MVSIASVGTASDAERSECPGGRQPPDGDVFDDGSGRAFPESCDELVQPLARSFGHAVERTIRHVGDPANEAEGMRFLEHEVPEANTMDTTRHSRLEPARRRFGGSPISPLSWHGNHAPWGLSSCHRRPTRPRERERIEHELR